MYYSKKVKVGNLYIGGNHPIVVQSMTATNTMDTEATVDQIIELVDAGCEIVRITTRNKKEATNLVSIKKLLNNKGIEVPLVADVHFNPDVAEIAAKHVEKVRINPGNYYSKADDGDSEGVISDKFLSLLEICSSNDTAIRIGVNHGSLSKRILYNYGDTPLGMVESLMEFVDICDNYGFINVILSVKTSNVKFMIETNLLLVSRLQERGLSYPIHLGVTEAGSDEEGRIKSAIGIGYLLSKGIGDTIRVSLAETPVAEIPVAKLLKDYFGRESTINNQILYKEIDVSIDNQISTFPLIFTFGKSENSDFSMGDLNNFDEDGNVHQEIKILHLENRSINNDSFPIIASVLSAISFIERKPKGIYIENTNLSDDELGKISQNILQALGLRITQTEFIACPTCGRTSINLVDILKELKARTSHMAGLKLAVMGCIVNGPGEMADAHYGILGAGPNRVHLYKGKTQMIKNIPSDSAVKSLISLIKKCGDWVDPN